MPRRTDDKYPAIPRASSRPVVLVEEHDVDEGAITAAKLAPVATPAWFGASLENSWVNYGAPYALSGFVNGEDSVVYLRGRIKNGTTAAGTLLFILPEGSRPPYEMVFATRHATGPMEVTIDTSGNVKVGSTGADATWSSLDGISFRTQ